MAEQKITIRQQQRIGAKLLSYNREVDSRLNSKTKRFKKLLCSIIAECYKEGFNDGVETERNEEERIKMKRRRAYY